MDRVFLAECPVYQFESILKHVEEAFAALSFDALVRPNMRVAVKPNLLLRSSPEAAAITHPLVTAAVARHLMDLGADVIVAESPGGPFTPAMLRSVYAGCGYLTMAETYGVRLNEECAQASLPAPKGRRCRNFSILKPIAEAELLVDVAKLKSHSMTGMSGAVKNLFGTVPGLLKPELHCRFPDKPDFGEMLCDLCEALAPQISIVDGITAMEGNGPSGGRPRYMGVLAAGTNPFALDTVLARMIHMRPEDIFMLRAAMARGLCSADEVALLGEPLEKFVAEDFLQPESKSGSFVYYLPRALRPAAEKLLTPVPKIRTRECVGCGKCAETCPQKTIVLADGKARINYRRCIRCYCCHEMCPKHVIDIKRLSLFDL